jgi:hypothetical protein
VVTEDDKYADIKKQLCAQVRLQHSSCAHSSGFEAATTSLLLGVQPLSSLSPVSVAFQGAASPCAGKTVLVCAGHACNQQVQGCRLAHPCECAAMHVLPIVA